MNLKHKTGTLYMIPTLLGESDWALVLPATVQKVIAENSHFVVENEKSARKFIKQICPDKIQSSLVLYPLNKHTESKDIPGYLQACMEGQSVGMISEAGCPGIADPGALLVAAAHQKNIAVVPLVGPSSIFLALMASGFNGQKFAFHGYLPIDKSEKKQVLKQLEKESQQKDQTQIFMETPYRNDKFLEDMLQTLQASTLLCIACDITLSTEFIKTKSVAQWKKDKISLHHRPAIFLIGSSN
jgi:16S rRNA (cytidine1402-2'-O)-methyltransferase